MLGGRLSTLASIRKGGKARQTEQVCVCGRSIRLAKVPRFTSHPVFYTSDLAVQTGSASFFTSHWFSRLARYYWGSGAEDWVPPAERIDLVFFSWFPSRRLWPFPSSPATVAALHPCLRFALLTLVVIGLRHMRAP